MCTGSSCSLLPHGHALDQWFSTAGLPEISCWSLKELTILMLYESYRPSDLSQNHYAQGDCHLPISVINKNAIEVVFDVFGTCRLVGTNILHRIEHLHVELGNQAPDYHVARRRSKMKLYMLCVSSQLGHWVPKCKEVVNYCSRQHITYSSGLGLSCTFQSVDCRGTVESKRMLFFFKSLLCSFCSQSIILVSL